MNKKIDALLARMDRARQIGGKSMWYMLFANAIADRLCEAETITRDEMRSIFAKRLEDAKETPEGEILASGYEECLARLDEFQKDNTATNGYAPTEL